MYFLKLCTAPNAGLPQLLYFPNFCTIQVRLDLTTFSLEAASRGSCTYDWLTVTDTDGSTLLERLGARKIFAKAILAPLFSFFLANFSKQYCWRVLQVLWEQLSLPGAAKQRSHCAHHLPQWRRGWEHGVQHRLESGSLHWLWKSWGSRKPQKKKQG